MRMPMTATGDAVPAPGQPGRPAGPLARLRCQARHAPALARQHWLFTALLAAGLVLRVLTQVAYRPALLYIDSTKYLLNAYPGDDPPGYQLALKPVLALGSLDLIPVIQHLLGLAMAVALYLVLLRRGAPRWLAALATAPVLLDAYQLQIEQNVMPDVMFEALIVTGLAALLWRLTPSPWLVVVAGLALGASATARQIGEIFILPASRAPATGTTPTRNCTASRWPRTRPAPSTAGWRRPRTAPPCGCPATSGRSARTPRRSGCSARTAWTTTPPRRSGATGSPA